MKQTGYLARRGLLMLTMVILLVGTGCDLTDPVVSVGSPSPVSTQSATPAETPAVQTETPSITQTPIASETPSAEQTKEPNGAGAYTIAADTSESQKTYYSEEADENALRIENAAVASIDGASVEKRSGDASSLENTMAYGLNAAVLVRAESQLDLIESQVTSNALGAGGVFVQDGMLRLQSGSVRTSGEASFGVAATSGGVIAHETSISTQGADSAALFTAQDGSISLEGGTAITGGEGSPVVSAAGRVDITSATLRANQSEAICVNGGTVSLTDCAVSGRMGDVVSVDTLVEPYCVVLYSDVPTGGNTSTFNMTRGALTALTGDLFYATNTNASIYLEEVSLTLDEDCLLLRVTGNDGSFGWGKDGSNGADCTLTAQNQVLTGDIVVDDLSSVSVVLNGESSYTGTINTANTALAAEVTLDDDATWTLTGNAYLTAFTGRISGIVTNGFSVYVNGVLLAG